MKIIKSFIACFSTYSRVPMPHVSLDSDDMKYALIFFPFIGAVIGLFEALLFIGCRYINVPVFVRTLIAAIIPVVITGGIHIDGFMDVMDAMNSYGDRQKKLEIMKDPHTGAFAVIYLGVYALCYMAFLYLINEKSIIPFCISFVASRVMSGISVVTINSAKDSGMLHSVKMSSEKKNVLGALIIIGIFDFGVIAHYSVYSAVAFLIICVGGYLIYKRKCIREFGGITGDTSGYYLCIMELLLLVASSIGGYL